MYTRFPHLLASGDDVESSEFSPRPALKVRGSETDLLRAWANLLRLYTGHDDEVRFALDEDSVIISFSGVGEIRKEHGVSNVQGGVIQTATAVFINSVSA